MDGVVILFLLLGGVGGLLLGLWAGWFFGGRSQPGKAAESRTEARPAGQETPAPPPPSLGVMLRRREEGLEVTLDGVVYRRYAAMPADSRRRLMAYLRLVGAWMEGKPTREIITAASPQRKPPSPASSAANGKKENGEKASLQHMIEQIDEIVQQLHAESGLSEPVRVVGGLKGGVNILVGLKRYEHIDYIPDAEVQALVRRAVQIWESRQ